MPVRGYRYENAVVAAHEVVVGVRVLSKEMKERERRIYTPRAPTEVYIYQNITHRFVSEGGVLPLARQGLIITHPVYISLQYHQPALHCFVFLDFIVNLGGLKIWEG